MEPKQKENNLIWGDSLKVVEIIHLYHQLCQQNQWKVDGAQEAALILLSDSLGRPKSWLSRLTRGWIGHEKVAGVYLYGDVGRGKTMVMDLFYGTVQGFKKRRFHFTEFMAMIHKTLKREAQNSQAKQPIDAVIDGLAKDIDLICLDEFQVCEIADAMLLSRLFSGLSQRGVQVIFTSNLAPHDLYQGGLHYDRFYPFIEWLCDKFKIFHLNNPANRDYRRLAYHPQNCYFTTDDPNAYEDCEKLLVQLTGTTVFHPSTLHVNHREILLPRVAKKAVWISFDDLCGAALGPSDYLALAKSYNLLFLTDVPSLTDDLKNEARRFISLIDVWYDHKNLLVMLLSTSLEQLFSIQDPSIPYKRTLSRLQEMQTLNYWES